MVVMLQLLKKVWVLFDVQGVPGQVTRLWSYVQGRVFNTFSWLISQIKAEGWANWLVESHFWCSHFLARTFKNLLKYRAANSKVPNETFFDSFETLWDCTYNFWRLYPIHSFKDLFLSQEYPVQSQSVSNASFGNGIL